MIRIRIVRTTGRSSCLAIEATRDLLGDLNRRAMGLAPRGFHGGNTIEEPPQHPMTPPPWPNTAEIMERDYYERFCRGPWKRFSRGL